MANRRSPIRALGRRWVGLVLVATLSAMAGLAAPAAAAVHQIPATVAQGKWQQLADKYYELGSAGYDQQVAAGQNVAAFHVAALAWYAGQKFGWHDPRTTRWLHRVYDRQDSDGGYGLGYPYASFDKVLNPADTSYTITTAWHVGRMLLDGYDHGAVPRAKLIDAATSLLNTAESPRGRCIAYSASPNDANERCVFNVTAAASLFLNESLERGIWVPGRLLETTRKIASWRDYLLANYRPTLNGWTYGRINNPALLDDPGHLAPTATAAYLLPTRRDITRSPSTSSTTRRRSPRSTCCRSTVAASTPTTSRRPPTRPATTTRPTQPPRSPSGPMRQSRCGCRPSAAGTRPDYGRGTPSTIPSPRR
jgi:hypothetical protein